MVKDKKELGKMLIDTHDLWDLEAFSREVRRRKVLEATYLKLYRDRKTEGADMALHPKEILDFIYSRAADNYPLYQ